MVGEAHVAVFFGLCGLLLARAQDPERPLGPGPTWRGVRPAAQNEVFATGDGCALCHSTSPKAMAMHGAVGEDISPHALWQASVMANSFRDPYWRAQVAKEVALDPQRGEQVEALCQRCHAPMLSHTRRLGGQGPIATAVAAADPLAQDGVSCTVCHQIRAEGLGTEATQDGRGLIGRNRRIFGPYRDPVAGPMSFNAGYQVQHGAHVQRASLCATCHTLHTQHTGARFPEQSPYLEWQNSVFTDEAGETATSRTCQQCHMADLGSTRIARDPDGGEFLIPVRDHYRSHAFVGGNAFLLDLLADHRDALGVTASVAALRRIALATRRFLAEATVSVTIGEITRGAGELCFDVRIENLTGHKFPSGHPSRRAWLHVQVRSGRNVVFDSGGYGRNGRLLDVQDELRQPHFTRVTNPSEVVVYELVGADSEGEPTTHLTRMSKRGKDTRLLPKGWRREGPNAEATAPVGTGNDFDFTAGGDTVSFAIPLGNDAPAVTVAAWVRFQTIPPHWVEAMRAVDAEECRRFVAMYDAAAKVPELVGVAQRVEDR